MAAFSSNPLWRMAMRLAIIIAAAMLFLPPDYSCASSISTARDFLAFLPTSIFENTPAGLDEDAKQLLLRQGNSDNWEISEENADSLVIAELPLGERKVALRLFRNDTDGSIIAAVGTIGDPVCTVELWQLDHSGRLYPVDTPPEPAIGDFFNNRHKPRPSQQNSVTICLGSDGLWARPLFWNQRGAVDPRPDRAITYHWNGNDFEKVVRPLKK